MLLAISVLLIFTMLFNVKFHSGVQTILLDDEELVYYSFLHNQHHSTLTLDLSNVSAKVQRFALLKENVICKEKEIQPFDDLNHYEIVLNKMTFGKYTMRLSTDENIDLTEEIEVVE